MQSIRFYGLAWGLWWSFLWSHYQWGNKNIFNLKKIIIKKFLESQGNSGSLKRASPREQVFPLVQAWGWVTPNSLWQLQHRELCLMWLLLPTQYPCYPPASHGPPSLCKENYRFSCYLWEIQVTESLELHGSADRKNPIYFIMDT